MENEFKPSEDTTGLAVAAPEERVVSRRGDEYLSSLVRGMALLLGVGASCGIAAWELVYGDLMVDYIRSNRRPESCCFCSPASDWHFRW